MKAPAQIFTALLAAGAASFLPLSTRFNEAGLLREKADRRTSAAQAAAAAEEATAAAGEANARGGAAAASRMERIPSPVSAADASRIIADIKALDGKMLPTRRVMELLESVMSLPESHLAEAQAAIEVQKNMVLSGFLCSALFSRWGELNPEGARTALEAASKSGNMIVKFAGAASLAGGWMEKDPDAFIKWVTEKKEGEGRDGDEMRRVMMEAALHGMANVDPATAEKLIASSPKDRRPWMIMDMAENNPDIDPRDAAARALEEAGENSGQRSGIHSRLGRTLAEKDPQEALKYAETVKPEERKNYYEAAFSSWMKKDKAEAMKWIASQPEDVQKDSVRGMRWQYNDMSYEDTAKIAGSVSKTAAEDVWFSAINEKARKSPQEAIDYLPNVAEEKRPSSYNGIASEWTKKDSQAASEWIYDLKPGKEKDYAIQGMVQELRSKEPDSSTIWAASVQDEQMRDRLVQENAKLWLKRDRPAAETWINDAPNLSEELKEKLLTPPAQ